MYYHFWVDYSMVTTVGVEQFQIEVNLDGNVTFYPAIYDLELWEDVAPFPDGFTCELGNSFKVTAPKKGTLTLAI
jgi:hypothetical protein